jgi:hypothetical protein
MQATQDECIESQRVVSEAREENTLDPTHDDAMYPRYPEGVYEAECVKVVIYRDPQFRAWKACLHFSFLGTGEEVCGFYHLGSKSKPHAGRRSEYYRAWIIANGEPPRKRQRLAVRVFRRKVFEVRVSDVTRRHDGRTHPKAMVYSTVREILRRVYP